MISAEITVSGYILPPPELPQIPLRVEMPSRRLHALAQLARCVAEARELLMAQSDKFETLFQLVANRADINADEIEKIAESVVSRQQPYLPQITAAFENLEKHVSELQQSKDPYLNGPVLRLAEDGIDICRTWLELYQNLHIRLMKLASDRHAGTEQGRPIFSDSNAAESYIRRLLAE